MKDYRTTLQRMWRAIPLFAGVCLALAVGAEDRMAWPEDVRLFAERRLKATMQPGQIAAAEPHETNRDWLKVRFRGQELDGRGAELWPLHQFREAFEKLKAGAEHEAQTIAAELTTARQRVMELKRASLIVTRDSALYYRVPVTKVEVTTPEGKKKRGKKNSKTKVEVAQQYNHISLIAPTQASRLRRDWEKEIKTGLDRIDGLERRRDEQVGQLIKEELRLEQVQDRFRQFAAGDERYLAEPHLTTGKRARLYQQRAAKHTLAPGDVVTAQPSSKYRDHLLVRFRGEDYYGAAKDLVSRTQFEIDHALEQLERSSQIERLALEEEEIRTLEALIASLSLDLDYRSRLATYGDYVTLGQIAIGPGLVGLYKVRRREDAIYAFSRSRARKVIRDWERQLAALRELREDRQEKSKALKVKAAGAASELERTLERFDAAVLAEAAAP